MEALQFDSIGDPAQVLVLRDIPKPTPKAGEVLIRVQARTINPSDLVYVRGNYGIRPKPPCGAGFEGMGVVELHGEGVDAASLLVGQRVSFTTLDGAWQEYVIANPHTVIPLPDSVSDEAGAQLFVNPLTAWAMLHECELERGDWLLLTAGASTFSQIVLQLAHARGIQTICTVRRDDHVAHLLALGAAAVVNTEKESLQARVRELTGRGVKRVLEAVGGKAGADALETLERGGQMLIYGMLSFEPMPLNSALLIFKTLTVRGFWLTEWFKTAERHVQEAAAAAMLERIASGELTLPVEATYPLASFKEAIAHAEGAGRGGKVLFVG
jgi:NADPH:quinone reductase-like Zn-dependent oxidoreductase